MRGLEERGEEERKKEGDDNKYMYYTFCLGQLIGRVAMVTVAEATTTEVCHNSLAQRECSVT